MMAGVTLDLIGDKAVRDTLKNLKDSVQRSVLRQSMRAAMSPINKDAKNRAPKRSGALKAAIAIKVHVHKRTGNVTGMVGVIHNAERKGKIPNLYAQRVEHGWDYRSPSSRGGNRTYPKMAADAKRVEVGGASGGARPFLRPALHSKKQEALAILTAKARSVLLREAAKAAAKGKAILR